MHFEVLVEDASGKEMLEHLIPKLIGTTHTFRVLPYRGIGRLPPNLRPDPTGKSQALLNDLPRILKGLGNTFAGYGDQYHAAVIVICDLDNKCLKEFRNELDRLLTTCHKQLAARFCIAVEEGEAWLLGDISAVLQGYPKAKREILAKYAKDSICGTWEVLANAIFPGGYQAIARNGHHEIGRIKSEWAAKIAPNIEIARNESPSFQYFVTQIRKLLNLTSA